MNPNAAVRAALSSPGPTVPALVHAIANTRGVAPNRVTEPRNPDLATTITSACSLRRKRGMSGPTGESLWNMRCLKIVSPEKEARSHGMDTVSYTHLRAHETDS